VWPIGFKMFQLLKYFDNFDNFTSHSMSILSSWALKDQLCQNKFGHDEEQFTLGRVSCHAKLWPTPPSFCSSSFRLRGCAYSGINGASPAMHFNW
jgi:hypothetical protein